MCSQALATTLVGSSSTPQPPSVGIEPDGELGLDPPALAGEAVALLDAALGVPAVAAHVPLADGAVEAGHRVGPPDDAGDQVARRRRCRSRRRGTRAERLVPQDEPRRRVRARCRTARPRSRGRCRRRRRRGPRRAPSPSAGSGSGRSSTTAGGVRLARRLRPVRAWEPLRHSGSISHLRPGGLRGSMRERAGCARTLPTLGGGTTPSLAH